jgi:hypothetical protein
MLGAHSGLVHPWRRVRLDLVFSNGYATGRGECQRSAKEGFARAMDDQETHCTRALCPMTRNRNADCTIRSSGRRRSFAQRMGYWLKEPFDQNETPSA